MTTLDFAPLFRSAIGFDHLARLANTAASTAEASYPPLISRKPTMTPIA